MIFDWILRILSYAVGAVIVLIWSFLILGVSIGVFRWITA